MIPRVKPYTAVSYKELACVTNSWADGDTFEGTKWHHMLNIVAPDWRGQEFPDIFDVVQGKVKQPKPPRRGKVRVRQLSLEEVFA